MEEKTEYLERNLKILVVDDEENILEVVKAFLESEGYEVDTADNGSSALSYVNIAPPHIVLLDVRMPDIDGIQCLRKIKNMAPEVEIVIMSGFATLQMAKKTLDIGAFDYLRKPLSFDHLKNVIEQIKITKFIEMM